MGDYGCSYTLVNNSSYDFLLSPSTNVVHGSWVTAPTNVPIGGVSSVHLKDGLGFHGSEAFIIYNVVKPGTSTPITTITIHEVDPFGPFDRNGFTLSSNSRVLSYTTPSVSATGHPVDVGSIPFTDANFEAMGAFLKTMPKELISKLVEDPSSSDANAAIREHFVAQAE